MEPRDEQGRIIRGPKVHKGATAPLFDRLVDLDHRQPQEAVSLRVHTETDMIQSIQRELGRLLNSRAPMRGAEQAAAAGTVLDYGLADWSNFNPASIDDRRRLEAILANRISTYEPRLSSVSVVLEHNPDFPLSLSGVIRAVVRLGKVGEAVTFPLAIDGKGAAVQILAPEPD